MIYDIYIIYYMKTFKNLKTFKKIGNPSSQLHHLFPVSRGSMHGRSLRNNNSYTLPKCRTERYKKSFIPAMCYNH